MLCSIDIVSWAHSAGRLFLPGAASVFAIMTLVWWIHLKIKNAGIVDIAWAGNIGLLALLYGCFGEGYGPRQGLMTAMGLAWSIRLALHLARRIVGRPEEGRYQALREVWGGNISLKFFFFFQVQTLLDLFFSLPFLLVCLNPLPADGIISVRFPSILEWAGFFLWMVALAGETLADRQLEQFKKGPSNRGRVCQTGLWRYSRHPNYFFEWLIWMAFFVFALSSPLGFLAILCPALMLFFLLRVTGIPATEEQAIRSKGDAYRDYQRTTNAFFPWFPRR